MTDNFVIQTPQFEWQEVNLKGDKRYYISGYISTIDPDDYNEVVTMQAQEKLLKACQDRMKSEAYITMDVEHEEYKEGDRVLRKPKNTRIPVAKIVEAELKEKGVWVKAEINRNGDRFKEVWNSIKEGYLHSFSIAFAPLKSITRRVNGVVQKFIEDLNLTNVTLTGSPVNPNATFTVSLKAKLNEDNTMVEENKQEPVAPQEEAPKTEEPQKQEEIQQEEATQESEEAPAEEKPLTPNELVENARALEKEKIQLQAEREAFEKQKAEFEAQAKPAEPQQPADLVASIKALKEENAELKSKLNAPILKSKIVTAEEKKVMKAEKTTSPLDLI